MRVLRNFPALAAVNIPRSAVILSVHDRGPEQAATLVASVDDADDEVEQRRFVVLGMGAAIPTGAAFVASFRRDGCGPNNSGIFCLFELAEEIPADVPAEAHRHYRHLLREGFEWRDGAWTAPADLGPLGHENIIALTTLREFGYGDCRNA